MNSDASGLPAPGFGYAVIDLDGPPSDMSGVPDEDALKVRTRATFHEDQLSRLLAVFAYDQLPTAVVKDQLAKELHLTPIQVDNWFRNRRQREAKAQSGVRVVRKRLRRDPDSIGHPGTATAPVPEPSTSTTSSSHWPSFPPGGSVPGTATHQALPHDHRAVGGSNTTTTQTNVDDAITIQTLAVGTWERFDSPTASLQARASPQQLSWCVREFGTGYEFMMVVAYDSVVNSEFHPSKDALDLAVGTVELSRAPRFFNRFVDRPGRTIPWAPCMDWTPDAQGTRVLRHKFEGSHRSVQRLVELINGNLLRDTRDLAVFQRLRHAHGVWGADPSSDAQGSSTSTREQLPQRVEVPRGASTRSSTVGTQALSRSYMNPSESNPAPFSLSAQPTANSWIPAHPLYQPHPPQAHNTFPVASTSTNTFGGGYAPSSNMSYGQLAPQNNLPLGSSSTTSYPLHSGAPHSQPAPLFREPDGSPYSYTAEQRISGHRLGSGQYPWPATAAPWVAGSQGLSPPGPHDVDSGFPTRSPALQTQPPSDPFTGTTMFPPTS